MPKMIDPSALERPVEKGDEAAAVDALLGAFERGIALESLYFTVESIAARRYDYETPAPNLPHGMMAVNAAWGLSPFLKGLEAPLVLGLAQGFAQIAAENRFFERARTVSRRPVRGISVPDLANLVIEKVEKGDIAEADGALLTLIESTHDRALVAKAFFLSGAQDLQNWGHKGVFAGHLWQIAERDSFNDFSLWLRPGIHYFAAFGPRDEKRQIERHAAGLDFSKVELERRAEGPEKVEALADHVLAGGSTRAIVEALQAGLGLEDVLDAIVLAACEDIRHSTKTIMAIETLTYAHSARIAVRAGGPSMLLPVLQAGVWAHDCASTRQLTPVPPVPEVADETAALWALLEDFAPTTGHAVKITEAVLAERASAPPWAGPRLTAALLHAAGGATTKRSMLERYQDRVKIEPELRKTQLTTAA